MFDKRVVAVLLRKKEVLRLVLEVGMASELECVWKITPGPVPEDALQLIHADFARGNVVDNVNEMSRSWA